MRRIELFWCLGSSGVNTATSFALLGFAGPLTAFLLLLLEPGKRFSPLKFLHFVGNLQIEIRGPCTCPETSLTNLTFLTPPPLLTMDPVETDDPGLELRSLAGANFEHIALASF